VLPGTGEQAHGMKSRLATCTAVCLYQEKGPRGIPESDGAGRADFNCSAQKTLRNTAPSANRGQQERKSDAGQYDDARFDERDDLMHELLGPFIKNRVFRL
jgi:hypothetical protein